MESVVEEVLRLEAEKESKYKPITVDKAIEVDVDEGNLLAIDSNPIELHEFCARKSAFLKDLARDSTQLLINRVFQLPTEKVDDVVIAKLPDPTTLLPREKPLPKTKKASKWEEYAKTKGIQKKKKGRMVWDEELKDWAPRWGYKRANDEGRDWAIDIPDNVDPNTDMFEKRRKEKQEKIAKNELQRLRNIARNMKGKVPGIGLTPTESPDKDHLKRAFVHAKTATASVGKFDGKLPKEKPSKNMGKKRKFEPNEADMKSEKRRALGILEKIQNKTDPMDVTRAVNQKQARDDRERSNSNGQKRQKGKGKKKGGKGKNDMDGTGQKGAARNTGGKLKMRRKNASKMSKRRAK